MAGILGAQNEVEARRKAAADGLVKYFVADKAASNMGAGNLPPSPLNIPKPSVTFCPRPRPA